MLEPGTVVRDGGLLVRDGVIVEVARSEAEASRLAEGATEVRLGRTARSSAWVTAGLVNAHAHLELTSIGPLSAEGGFGPWVGRVLEERGRKTHGELSSGVEEGARMLARSGVTAVGDIDSMGIAASVLPGLPLPALLYRETLDARDSTRTRGALDGVTEPPGEIPSLGHGLSPHAPYTVSQELLVGLGELAARDALPVTIHWSETADELDYMERGEGPLVSLLGPTPGIPGLDLIERAGLLRGSTSLVHGNHPRPGEAERICTAGATLVHCPGTHLYFGREPFPLDVYREAGVRLALGTDSLASNQLLDMREELALFSTVFPEVPLAEVWGMATTGGAAALGQAGRMGRILPGHRADLCVWDLEAQEAGPALEELVRGRPELVESFASGRPLVSP